MSRAAPALATDTSPIAGEEVPGDLRMTLALGPVLVASTVGLLPFTVFSTFLVPIAAAADSSVATVGGLRGLGGLAALVVGTALAPLFARLRRDLVAAAGLALLAGASLLGAAGDFVTLAAFCLLVGAATAVLNPALATAAADRFGSGPAAGRAATLVTATQSLAAMLAAPLIALPALLWGWNGNLLAIAAIALALMVVFARRGRGQPEADEDAKFGYLASFKALAAVPGAVGLLAIAMLRTAAFMGYLAYLAAFYGERFDLTPAQFAFVWTLSGTAFFFGNLLAGRWMNASARLKPERMLLVGLGAATIALVALFAAQRLPVALVLTAVLAASHAVVAASVVSLLVRRCGALRGSALSLNGAGMSFGVFAGASIGGLGLGIAGYPGIAVGLGGLTLIAFIVALVSVRPGHGRRPSAAGTTPVRASTD